MVYMNDLIWVYTKKEKRKKKCRIKSFLVILSTTIVMGEQRLLECVRDEEHNHLSCPGKFF